MKLLSSIVFSLILVLGIGFVAQQAHAQVAGCTTTAGYNTSTGMSCNGATTIPAGCSSTAGFSTSSGLPCNGNTATMNGYNGVTAGANGYLNGCTSLNGYSSTTGYACNAPINGIIYAGPAGTVNTGLPAGGYTPASGTTTPGLPTTGATNAVGTIALLLASALVSFYGIRYAIRHSTHN